jgi:hypothetical protein
MNATQTQEAAKLNYLYAFESIFRAKCAAAGIDASKWSQGMWTNAHMRYGMQWVDECKGFYKKHPLAAK